MMSSVTAVLANSDTQNEKPSLSPSCWEAHPRAFYISSSSGEVRRRRRKREGEWEKKEAKQRWIKFL
jgi:hypothetical protein